MALIDKYFSKDDLQKITEACEKAEEKTAGEVRVSIFSKRPRKLKNLSLKEVAQAEFFRLGMDKTRDKTGILLLIILVERKFQILADSGINAKVDQHIGRFDVSYHRYCHYFYQIQCIYPSSYTL